MSGTLPLGTPIADCQNWTYRLPLWFRKLLRWEYELQLVKDGVLQDFDGLFPRWFAKRIPLDENTRVVNVRTGERL